jgi:hypothetical protein
MLPLGDRQQATVAQLLVLCCAILPRCIGVLLDSQATVLYTELADGWMVAGPASLML